MQSKKNAVPLYLFLKCNLSTHAHKRKMSLDLTNLDVGVTSTVVV